MKGMKLYNRSTLYSMALKTFGPEAQTMKLIEEAAELAAAAARNMNGLGNEVDLAGELADVEIMTEQFRINGLGKLIDFKKQEKLERLAKRIGCSYRTADDIHPTVSDDGLAALIKKLPRRELLEDWCGAVPNSAFIGAADQEIAVMSEFILAVLDLQNAGMFGGPYAGK